MSKEIIDKINNNLIMLVEGFDDAERDYGYDLANEKHYVSELIDLVKNLYLSGVVLQSEQLPKNNCTLNIQTCGKGSGCKYPHCHI
jgi:hypothetical protein|tara:strand:+ start:19 stop:276 length:258 start_codon:yes stop_codon:yes gene_type:complete